jgi:hypothetical protein
LRFSWEPILKFFNAKSQGRQGAKIFDKTFSRPGSREARKLVTTTRRAPVKVRGAFGFQ